MGVVYADIELINSIDLSMARRNLIGAEEVKRIHLSMMVDNGAYMMAINETIQSQIEFSFIEKRKVQLASGQVAEYDVVGPIDVRIQTGGRFAALFYYPETL